MDNPTPKNPRNTRELQNSMLGFLWQPAGVIYLLLCLAALAAGLWPDAIYPPKADFRPAPLPTLQTLAVGQVIWFLLVSPLVRMFRNSSRTRADSPDVRHVVSPSERCIVPPSGGQPSTLSEKNVGCHASACRSMNVTDSSPRPAPRGGPPRTTILSGQSIGLRYEIVETLWLFIVAVPFYIAAGWFANATVTDCLRTALAVAAFCPLGWLAGRLLAAGCHSQLDESHSQPDECQPQPGGLGHPPGVFRSCVLAGLLAITVGQVGLYYIFIEFLPPVSARWIWHSCPATFAWSAAASRNPAIAPEPLWALLLWLGVALAGGAVLWARQSARQRPHTLGCG